MSEKETRMTWDTAAQGWDIPDSIREGRQAEQDSDNPYVPVRQMGASKEPERRQPRSTRPSPDYQISAWVEFKRGCWMAAGATAFFAVVFPLILLIMSLMGVSFIRLLTALFS